MKRLLFLYIFIAHQSLGSSLCEERISNSSPQTIEDYEKYKRIVSAFFCEKALAQQKEDIACRCGTYGLGDDWRSAYKNVRYPSVLEVTNKRGLILSLVAHDMLYQLPDIADWLRQNAK